MPQERGMQYWRGQGRCGFAANQTPKALPPVGEAFRREAPCLSAFARASRARILPKGKGPRPRNLPPRAPFSSPQAFAVHEGARRPRRHTLSCPKKVPKAVPVFCKSILTRKGTFPLRYKVSFPFAKVGFAPRWTPPKSGEQCPS